MALSVIDRSILPAEKFNMIPDFCSQDRVIDNTTLDELGQIFVAYSMHNKAGIGLLHRHDTLAEHQVMVHKLRDMQQDIALPEDISKTPTDKFGAYAFFLNQEDQFQAFEYDSTGNSLVLADEFAMELRDYLKSRSLEHKIAIVPNPALEVGEGKSIEYTHPSGVGTIRVPLENEPMGEIIGGEPTTTCWSFSVRETGGLDHVPGGTCRTTSEGVHRMYANVDIGHRERSFCVPTRGGRHSGYVTGKPLSTRISTERKSPPGSIKCNGDTVCVSRPGGFHYQYTSSKPLASENQESKAFCVSGEHGFEYESVDSKHWPTGGDSTCGVDPEQFQAVELVRAPGGAVEAVRGTICVPTDQGDHFRYLYGK